MSDGAAAYARSAAYTLLDRGGPRLAVLLHGLGGDRAQPLGLTPDRLESTGVSVLAPDARAHGETPVIGGAERFTAAALTEDVLALVDHLDLGDRRMIPIGISMGAMVGLQLLRTVPDRVERAVLIRPSFTDRPWPAHLRVFRDVAELLRDHGVAGVERFSRSDAYQWYVNASPAGAASLLGQFEKPGSQKRAIRLETVPNVAAIDWEGVLDPGCPVTVVGAEGDPQHPLDVARMWHERIAGSDLVVVPSRDLDPEGYASRLAATITRSVATAPS